MTTLDAAQAHFVSRFEDCEAQLGGSSPAWLAPIRRAAIERTKTSGSMPWEVMRTRSPRIAPPETGLEGSTAITPTLKSRLRSSVI